VAVAEFMAVVLLALQGLAVEVLVQVLALMELQELQTQVVAVVAVVVTQ
jgi:hypothetical protein